MPIGTFKLIIEMLPDEALIESLNFIYFDINYLKAIHMELFQRGLVDN